MKKIFSTAMLFCLTLLAWAQPGGFGGFQMASVEPQYKDINYAGDDLEAHRLDIYLPKTQQEKYKVIVAIYGSAWFSNNMKAMTYMSLGKPLTDAGFAVVCINHRSSGDAKFPAQIHDVKAAIRFIRAHAAEYKLDTSFVGITGFSSGGHLSSLAGVTNDMKKRKVGNTEVDLEGTVGNCLSQSSRVDAVVDWFGPVDMARMENCETVKDGQSPEAALIGGAPADNPDMVALISPITYVSKNCPRFLVFHGDADNVVPHCQGVYFSEALQKAGCLEEFITAPGGGHGPGTFNDETFKKMVDFFVKEANKNAVGEGKIISPNGKLSIIKQNGKFVVQYMNQPALDITAFGYQDMLLSPQTSWKFAGYLLSDYTMLSGKCLHPTNEANEYQAKISANVQLVLRLYNDGIAFRYELSGLKNEALPEEKTTYRIPEGTKRWMMKWSDGYEGFYPLSTIAEEKGRWGYPSLVEPADGIFTLLTEANIERQQSASCLYNNGALYSVVPDQNEVKVSGRWHSPWRIAIIGKLSDVVESTLVTDVCEPNKLKESDWIQPGVVSWIYWAYNHGSNDLNIIKKYVDMAVTLHLPYVLIDAEWDEMKDGKTIDDALNYAKERGIRPMIWYNSSVGWINGAPGPKFRLNKPEDREREFAWCESHGVAGVKIDFFSGDNQMNMDYCIDLLESAARHHLLVNFHGATIPRGWQRTYPNLLSTEGVYGAEWYNNVPTFTNKAAAHNATLPFTRNVIGPMDYTPCAFSDSQHPHITSHAHELALTALYESGLQHLADRPESFLAQPSEVQQYLGNLPAAWDETRLLSGYPADHAVIARRSAGTWYVAGINGTDTAKDITFSLGSIAQPSASMTTFEDSGDTANPWQIRQQVPVITAQQKITLQPRGGFVFVIK